MGFSLFIFSFFNQYCLTIAGLSKSKVYSNYRDIHTSILGVYMAIGNFFHFGLYLILGYWEYIPWQSCSYSYCHWHILNIEYIELLHFSFSGPILHSTNLIFWKFTSQLHRVLLLLLQYSCAENYSKPAKCSHSEINFYHLLRIPYHTISNSTFQKRQNIKKKF